MGKTFDELVYGGSLQPSSFGRPLRNARAEQADARDESTVFARNAKADAYEQQVNKKYAAEQVLKNKLIETYGTSDEDEIAQLKATGLLNKQGDIVGDVEMQMRLDPEGTRQRIERFQQVAGMGDVATTPEAPQRQFYEGVGQAGERYFTNLSPAELKQEQHARGGKYEPSVTGLRAINPEHMGGGGRISGGDDKTPERVAFEGKVAQLMGIAEQPERDVAHEKKVQDITQRFVDRAMETDMTTALKELEAGTFDGTLLKEGVFPRDIKAINKELVSRAVTPKQARARRGVPPDRSIPWVRPTKEGMADLAEPTSLINPGGGPTTIEQARQGEAMARSNNTGAVEQGLGQEIPRTTHYAKGGKVPTPTSTPSMGKVPTPFSNVRPRGDEPNPIDPFAELLEKFAQPPKRVGMTDALKRKEADAFRFGNF